MTGTKEKKTNRKGKENKSDPCWSGYKAHGTKTLKSGKEVPNCKPEK